MIREELIQRPKEGKELDLNEEVNRKSGILKPSEQKKESWPKMKLEEFAEVGRLGKYCH